MTQDGQQDKGGELHSNGSRRNTASNPRGKCASIESSQLLRIAPSSSQRRWPVDQRRRMMRQKITPFTLAAAAAAASAIV